MTSTNCKKVPVHCCRRPTDETQFSRPRTAAVPFILSIEFCCPAAPGRSTSDIVRVELTPEVELDLERLQRNFYTTSSCGICGKAALDALHVQGLEMLDPSRPLRATLGDSSTPRRAAREGA